MSDALRHLGIAEHAAGRPDKARERLEESVRIRTQLAAGSPLPPTVNRPACAHRQDRVRPRHARQSRKHRR
jgi:hypothetical protein